MSMIVPLYNQKGKVIASAIVDDEDYERTARHRWYRHNAGYAASGWDIDGVTVHVLLHRFVMLAGKGDYVDHCDGNRLDCRKKNLRICTQIQNMQNMRKPRGGSSQFKGVSWYKRDQNWRAYIKVDKKEIHLGYFSLETDAALAYNAAATKYFGEFAALNELMSGQFFRESA